MKAKLLLLIVILLFGPNLKAATTVDTIAQLRGQYPNQTIEALGYYATGDGGGGTFVPGAIASGEIPDDGMIVEGLTLGGTTYVWRRTPSASPFVIESKWYGVFGGLAAFEATANAISDYFVVDTTGFDQGQAVLVEGTSLPSGINAGQTYYLGYPAPNTSPYETARIYDTPANALANGSTGLIGFSSAGADVKLRPADESERRTRLHRYAETHSSTVSAIYYPSVYYVADLSNLASLDPTQKPWMYVQSEAKTYEFFPGAIFADADGKYIVPSTYTGVTGSWVQHPGTAALRVTDFGVKGDGAHGLRTQAKPHPGPHANAIGQSVTVDLDLEDERNRIQRVFNIAKIQPWYQTVLFPWSTNCYAFYTHVLIQRDNLAIKGEPHPTTGARPTLKVYYNPLNKILIGSLDDPNTTAYEPNTVAIAPAFYVDKKVHITTQLDFNTYVWTVTNNGEQYSSGEFHHITFEGLQLDQHRIGYPPRDEDQILLQQFPLIFALKCDDLTIKDCEFNGTVRRGITLSGGFRARILDNVFNGCGVHINPANPYAAILSGDGNFNPPTLRQNKVHYAAFDTLIEGNTFNTGFKNYANVLFLTGAHRFIIRANSFTDIEYSVPIQVYCNDRGPVDEQGNPSTIISGTIYTNDISGTFAFRTSGGELRSSAGVKVEANIGHHNRWFFGSNPTEPLSIVDVIAPPGYPTQTSNATVPLGDYSFTMDVDVSFNTIRELSSTRETLNGVPADNNTRILAADHGLPTGSAMQIGTNVYYARRIDASKFEIYDTAAHSFPPSDPSIPYTLGLQPVPAPLPNESMIAFTLLTPSYGIYLDCAHGSADGSTVTPLRLRNNTVVTSLAPVMLGGNADYVQVTDNKLRSGAVNFISAPESAQASIKTSNFSTIGRTSTGEYVCYHFKFCAHISSTPTAYIRNGNYYEHADDGPFHANESAWPVVQNLAIGANSITTGANDRFTFWNFRGCLNGFSFSDNDVTFKGANASETPADQKILYLNQVCGVQEISRNTFRLDADCGGEMIRITGKVIENDGVGNPILDSQGQLIWIPSEDRLQLAMNENLLVNAQNRLALTKLSNGYFTLKRNGVGSDPNANSSYNWGNLEIEGSFTYDSNGSAQGGSVTLVDGFSTFQTDSNDIQVDQPRAAVLALNLHSANSPTVSLNNDYIKNATTTAVGVVIFKNCANVDVNDIWVQSSSTARMLHFLRDALLPSPPSSLYIAVSGDIMKMYTSTDAADRWYGNCNPPQPFEKTGQTWLGDRYFLFTSTPSPPTFSVTYSFTGALWSIDGSGNPVAYSAPSAWVPNPLSP